MKRLEMLFAMSQTMEAGELLENVIRALSDDEAKEVFEYIARMYDIDLNSLLEEQERLKDVYNSLDR